MNGLRNSDSASVGLWQDVRLHIDEYLFRWYYHLVSFVCCEILFGDIQTRWRRVSNTNPKYLYWLNILIIRFILFMVKIILTTENKKNTIKDNWKRNYLYLKYLIMSITYTYRCFTYKDKFMIQYTNNVPSYLKTNI